MADPTSDLGNRLAELAAAMEKAAKVEKGITDDQLSAAFEGPAILATRFYGTITSGGVRLSFCEDVGAPPRSIFRTAVFLPRKDAVALKSLLEQMLLDVEAKDVEDAPKHAG